MLWVIFWFIFAFVVAAGASGRGRSGLGWFVLAIAISPVLAVILLFLLPRVEAATEAAPTRACPFCKEAIRLDAIKCKHCGSTVEPVADVEPSAELVRAKIEYPTIQADVNRLARWAGFRSASADAPPPDEAAKHP